MNCFHNVASNERQVFLLVPVLRGARQEFVQMRRDRLIFAMMMGIPLIQLTLFCFAINTDPKTLPTAVLSADHSLFSITLIRGLENSGYFRIARILQSKAEAENLLATPCGP